MQTKEALRSYITQREQEIASYQVNIDNYTTMLTLIPCEVPDRLQDFAFQKIEELLGKLPESDLQLLSDMQFHAKISGMLIIEKLEQRKTQFVLDALKFQLAQLEK